MIIFLYYYCIMCNILTVLTRTLSYLVGQELLHLNCVFIHFHAVCMRAEKDLARLRLGLGCSLMN